MIRFQKTSVPKKLLIRDVWLLYQTLQSGLSDRTEEFMIDEITDLMGRMDEYQFKQSLKIMYDDVNWMQTPLDLALMFVRGIKKANLFEFVEFVKVTRGSTQS